MRHLVSMLQKTLLSNYLSDIDSVIMIVLERLARAENTHKYGDLALMVGILELHLLNSRLEIAVELLIQAAVSCGCLC